MQKTAEIDRAIEAGLEYITAQQLPDGSFESFSSPSARPFRPEAMYRTTFTTALVLASLAGAGVPGSKKTCRRAAEFLRGQAADGWSFNYWAKGTKQRRIQPYPDDLDDTFCALAALYLHDPGIIDAAVLAKATKLLLAAENAVGGPYRTWLVASDSKPVWLDVDVAVNANVAFFLSLIGSPLPKLVGFLDDAIGRSDLKSPYYPSQTVSAYYIARGYSGRRKDELIKIILSQLAKSKTVQDASLCVSSLLRLDPSLSIRVSGAVATILDEQAEDGSWPAAAFCLDPEVNGHTYYNGASALTTALALEALQLYYRSVRESPISVRNAEAGHTRTLQKRVLKLAARQCRNLEPGLRGSAATALETIASGGNSREIIGLAGAFQASLVKKPARLKADYIETLSLASLYGWLAYTIYDDFIDEEGKPGLLPVANVAMRRSLENYCAVRPADQVFHAQIRRIFDTIDGANAWELAHCRFQRRGELLIIGRLPNYGDLSALADRSIGHALVPLAILEFAGKGPGTPAFRSLLKAFRHYLIARQLNDDAHDWPEDLQNGHITPVVAKLLKELKVKQGKQSVKDLLASARPQFWHYTLPEICRMTKRHINLSRQAVKRISLLKPENVITDLLGGLEASVADTLHQQNQAEDFLKHYQLPAKEGS
jgi:hypothetical protein